MDRLTLFCFPHAGGTPGSFAQLSRHLGVGMTTTTVPYREPRGSVSTLADVIEIADRFVDSARQPRFAFYGHSMGALVALGLAQRRAGSPRPLPLQLLVGACGAPHLPGQRDRLTQLIDQTRVAATGSVAEARVRRRVLADLVLCRTFVPTSTTLSCPVHALAGTQDPLITPPTVQAWRRYAARDFSLHLVGGGHFFARDNAAEVAGLVKRLLQG